MSSDRERVIKEFADERPPPVSITALDIREAPMLERCISDVRDNILYESNRVANLYLFPDPQSATNRSVLVCARRIPEVVRMVTESGTEYPETCVCYNCLLDRKAELKYRERKLQRMKDKLADLIEWRYKLTPYTPPARPMSTAERIFGPPTPFGK